MNTKKLVKSLMLLSLLFLGFDFNTTAEEKEKVVCVDYEVKCEKASVKGVVCVTTTSEILSKAIAIAEVACR
ncbi:hypothetical protein [Tenuifilum thalassicum]|uniref:Uncharacterized protein n=1 Tax=Tenuifilum thalassicum TaxID=2590900 RepID=A0A7D3XW55_9BACT|nr:hypothetical protein [Tenuifilum thalassicum]QKG80291.1 hypothetical protein FHG85_08465 [Tenuifilum thalassicum]